MIQIQFQAQLSSEKVLDLEIIDKKIPWLNNKTLIEKIMSFKEKVQKQERSFVSMEKTLEWSRLSYFSSKDI